MNRRLRAALLLPAAALAGIVAAGMVGRDEGSGGVERYGPLVPVVVTEAGLRGSRPITAALARRSLRVIRVPGRFLPRGAIRDPRRAIGLEPRADLPAGIYLSAGLLRPPGADDARAARRRPGPGRTAVEIAVSGISALRYGPGARRVDVVVTSDAGPAGRGRAWLAARDVPLLGLSPDPRGRFGGSTALLGLTRAEALRLIRAETYARGIRLLPRPPGA